MTIAEAEKQYNIEIVDREFIQDEDIQNYWLNLECCIKSDFPDFCEVEYWSKNHPEDKNIIYAEKH